MNNLRIVATEISFPSKNGEGTPSEQLTQQLTIETAGLNSDYEVPFASEIVSINNQHFLLSQQDLSKIIVLFRDKDTNELINMDNYVNDSRFIMSFEEISLLRQIKAITIDDITYEIFDDMQFKVDRELNCRQLVISVKQKN